MEKCKISGSQIRTCHLAFALTLREHFGHHCANFMLQYDNRVFIMRIAWMITLFIEIAAYVIFTFSKKSHLHWLLVILAWLAMLVRMEVSYSDAFLWDLWGPIKIHVCPMPKSRLLSVFSGRNYILFCSDSDWSISSNICRSSHLIHYSIRIFQDRFFLFVIWTLFLLKTGSEL